MELEKYTNKVNIDTATIPNYNADNVYFATAIKGDCLNHNDCPIRIKDGDLLLAHRIDRREFIRNWQVYQNKIVLVEPFSAFAPYTMQPSGHYECMGYGRSALVKQFVGVEHGFFAMLRMFNPPTTLSINLDEIKEISIIDKVLEP